MYGFFGHALQLLERARDARHLDAIVFAHLRRAVVEWHRNVFRVKAPFDIAEKALEKLSDKAAHMRERLS